MGETKVCKGCGEVKLLDAFQREPRMKDGHRGKCRTCIDARRRLRYLSKHPIAEEPTTKVCTRCGEAKPFEAFPVDNGNRDGRRQPCYDCRGGRILLPLSHPTDPSLRVCRKCGEAKSLDQFRQHKHNSDGHTYIDGRCKQCQSVYDKAWNAAQKDRIPKRECIYCHQPFANKDRSAKYCSISCCRKYHAKGTLVSCPICNKEFYRHPSSPRIYCSSTCAKGNHRTTKGRILSAEVRRKLSEGHLRLGKRLPPRVKSCAHCQTSYTPKGRGRSANISRFCSQTCWYAYLQHHPDANRRFRGGMPLYYGPNWNEQKRQARKRDGHTCQDCGRQHKQGEKAFAVHHIKPRRLFLDDYIAANDLANLITLCASCHTAREWRECETYNAVAAD